MHKKASYIALALLLLSMESIIMSTPAPIALHDKTFAVSISQTEIETRIKELGAQITKDYAGKRPIFIGVLKGAFMFLSDLVKAVDLECEVAFLQVSSYANATRSSGSIDVLQALSTDISGRDVIIVEDIVDTGLSMEFLRGLLQHSNPRSIRIATLLDKKLSDLDFPLDYVGFEIAPNFVIGYGLDYAQLGRNLPAIYTLVK